MKKPNLEVNKQNSFRQIPFDVAFENYYVNNVQLLAPYLTQEQLSNVVYRILNTKTKWQDTVFALVEYIEAIPHDDFLEENRVEIPKKSQVLVVKKELPQYCSSFRANNFLPMASIVYEAAKTKKPELALKLFNAIGITLLVTLV